MLNVHDSQIHVHISTYQELGAWCLCGSNLLVMLGWCWVILLLLLWSSLELNTLLFLSDGAGVHGAWHAVSSSFAVAVEMDGGENEGDDKQDATRDKYHSNRRRGKTYNSRPPRPEAAANELR